MKKSLSRFQLIALDTNIFAYYLDRQSSFYTKAEQLFRFIDENRLRMVTSIITLTELLSLQAVEPMLERLEDEFYSTPNLSVIEVNRVIAREAAAIRREYGFKLPDAVQLATALSAKAKAFITNDQRLKSFKKLKIILLADLA